MKNTEKLDLIEKIIQYHPSSKAGIEGGWCHYTGGMKDSGDWNYRNLIFARLDVLEQLLSDLKEEWKPIVEKIYTDHEKQKQQNIIKTDKGWTNEFEKDNWGSFLAGNEKKMFDL